jgi:hypothetical protein
MKLQYVSDNRGRKTGVFIPIADWNILKTHLSGVFSLEIEEPTKAEILRGFSDALNEVKRHRDGNVKLKSARELLHEL